MISDVMSSKDELWITIFKINIEIDFYQKNCKPLY